MTVNHYFLMSQGYFDAAALTKPLLHMWTLAVEEQFYLVTPLILIALTWAASANRFGANRFGLWVAATCGLGILSFIACVAFTFPAGFSPDPFASNLPANVSFYMMPFRGWEFILGGAAPSLALCTPDRGWRKRSTAFGTRCTSFSSGSHVVVARPQQTHM